MSFAQRFAAGQQIAKGLIDTYDTGVRNRELKAVDDWKPSEAYDGYTGQDAAQMHAIANAKDADGNPYYQMQDDGRGGLAVRSNFAYAGADGAQVAPGSTVGLAPRRVTDFGGQRFDEAELTPQRMQALQDQERIRIMGRTDPELGMRMRRQATQDDREEKRFGWEQGMQPLKQRAAELQLGAGERAERAGARVEGVQEIEDAAMTMPDAEVQSALTGYLNTNKSDLPLLVTGKTKDGLLIAERDPGTGELGTPFAVPLSVGRKLVVGQILSTMGKGAEALKYLEGVDANIMAIVEKYNKQTADLVKSNNDATVDGSRMRNDDARTGIARAGLALRGQGGGRAEKPEDTGPNWKPVEDGKTRHDERSGRTQTFTNGEWVDMGGVSAAELPQWMDANDLPPGSEMLIQRLPTGHVMIPDAGDAVYEPGNPRHVKELKAALARVTQVMERNGSARPPVQNDPRNESAFEQRRTAIIAQEQARQQALAQQAAADRAAREAAAEQERQRRLAARPDLNQMGLRPMTQ